MSIPNVTEYLLRAAKLMASNWHNTFFAIAIVCMATTAGQAQVIHVPLYTLQTDMNDDGFARSVNVVGDVNGDGYADLIVGAAGDGNNGLRSGSAHVFSGLDGSTLFTFNGDSAGDNFGASISGAGDVNGDDVADFIIGAAQSRSTMGGYARVFVSVPEPEPEILSLLAVCGLLLLHRSPRTSA